MSLVFGAICPHPPILIPSIGRENLKKIKKTKQAIERLAEDFYQAMPDTVIVISPHGQVMTENFVINHSPVLNVDLADFGDLDTKFTFKNDLGFAYQIRESVETSIPLILTAEEKLDYGISVPLLCLTKQKRNISVIPLSYSLLDFFAHYNFGRAIRKVINLSNKRVAVVASGDLSHRLKENSPAGYSPLGKVFDRKLIKFLKEKNIKGLLDFDKNLIEDAGECGFRSFLILLGIFENSSYKIDILSYQGPFGVGYLVAEFSLK